MTQSAAQSAGQSPPSPPQCLSQVLFLTPVLLPSQQRRPSLSTQTSDARYTVPSRALSLSSLSLLLPSDPHTNTHTVWPPLVYAASCRGVCGHSTSIRGDGQLLCAPRVRRTLTMGSAAAGKLTFYYVSKSDCIHKDGLSETHVIIYTHVQYL